MIQHRNEQPTPPERVVVLGGTGFLGRYVVARLEGAGVPVVSLSSRDLDLTAEAAVDQLVDVLRESDTLLFCSCLTPDKGRDVATTMQNLAMGQHVAAAIERSPCRHLVYVSSDAVYADDVTLAHEGSNASPGSLYGIAHLGRERMMEFAAGRADVDLLILRPSIVYGVDDTHNSYGPNRFRRAADANGRIELFGGGEETRDHVFVEDAARLIEQCLLHRSTGVLNVATGTSTPFIEIAREVATLMGVEVLCHPRTNPITHRHYDVTAGIRAFPDFRWTPLREGLRIVHEAHVAASPDRAVA